MNRFAVAIGRAFHPAYNQFFSEAICILIPLCIGMLVYLGTGKLEFAATAYAFSFMMAVMLEAILVVLKQILERLPPKQ